MRSVECGLPPGVVILCTGEITRYAASMQAWFQLALPVRSGAYWSTGCLIAAGLNKGLAAMHDNPEMQWAWIMGDDHTFAPEVLLRLLAREVDVVLPLCLNRGLPFNPVVRDYGDGFDAPSRQKPLDEMPTFGLYRLSPTELAGDAGLLLRRNVTEAIPRPWHDHRKSGALTSEDQAFCKRIKDAGFDVHVDCNEPIGHIVPMAITPVVADGKWSISFTVGAEGSEAFRQPPETINGG